jgi:hypothetical protein
MWLSAVFLIYAASLAPAPADAPLQAPSTAVLAKQLVDAMGRGGLDALAVRDPQTPGAAIAVLAIPQSQLLVVAGPYPDAANLDALLTHKMYRDVYSGLQQPSVTQGKLFILDMGCDGLDPTGRENVDVMYENAGTQTIFDGDWKKQKLSEAEYQERARGAESRYARLLSALLTAAQPKTH